MVQSTGNLPGAGIFGGTVYSKTHATAFSFISNQASLAQLNNVSAAIYGDRPFLQADLNNYLAALCIPAPPGSFGLKLRFGGSTLYRESQAGIAYARSLGTKLDLGVQFNYSTVRIPVYGNSSAISWETGAVFHLSPKLHTGFHVNNPIGGRFGKSKEEKLPSIYKMGIGYSPSPILLVSMEVCKEQSQPVQISTTIHYRIIHLLVLRLGMSTTVSPLSAGVGFYFKNFQLNVLTSYHPQLGITPGIAIFFDRPLKEESQ
jgi:hypothetical protein